MNNLGKLRIDRRRRKTLLLTLIFTFLITQIACDDCPSSDKGCVTGAVVWKQGKTQAVSTQVLLCKYININSGFGELTNLGCVGQIAETVTNAEGVYQFQNVQPGKYAILVKVPDSDKYTCVIKKNQKDLFNVQPYAEEFLVNAGQTTKFITVEVSN